MSPAPAREPSRAGRSAAASRPESLTDLIWQLQRSAGNRAVVELLAPHPAPVLQRAPATYQPGESERATASGVISPDVRLLAATGSGYDAAASSVLIADFRPNSAVVRTSTAEELQRGTWRTIIERNTAEQFAIRGFTDATGPESGAARLRADRARAVAALFPGTAKRGVVEAAPAGDFIAPANATAEQRALNRSVLLRLPPAELREASQVRRYAGDAVAFWRANPTSTVSDLLTHVSGRAGAQLSRNGVPPPDVVRGAVPRGSSTLAYFAADDWRITIDAAALAASSPQKGLTSSTKLSAVDVSSVAHFSQACYHEARHAEQDFLAARLTAEKSAGSDSPATLAKKLGIREDVAEAAISAASVPLPDVLKTKAGGWQSFMEGGRHVGYHRWNERLRAALELIKTELLPQLAIWETQSLAVIRAAWQSDIKPVMDTLRHGFLSRVEDMMQPLLDDPRPQPVDVDVRTSLESTTKALLAVHAYNGRGLRLPDPITLTGKTALEQKLEERKAQALVGRLRLAVLEASRAAEAAYLAYPGEKDAYEVGAAVTTSVTTQGSIGP